MKRGTGQPFREEDPRLRAGLSRRQPGRHAQAARSSRTAWPGRPMPGSRPRAGRRTSTATRTSSCSDHWLGAAWKAMPADLSHDRLGRRVLDLLDDMANWGQRKYVLGEVDVFKLDHTHELYGHMNVNYVRLDRVPRFDEGWKPRAREPAGRPVLRDHGRGPDPRVHGRRPRERARSLAIPGAGPSEVHARLRWTFPLRFAELVSGDGDKVYRQRIDLLGHRSVRREELQARRRPRRAGPGSGSRPGTSPATGRSRSRSG